MEFMGYGRPDGQVGTRNFVGSEIYAFSCKHRSISQRSIVLRDELCPNRAAGHFLVWRIV